METLLAMPGITCPSPYDAMHIDLFEVFDKTYGPKARSGLKSCYYSNLRLLGMFGYL